MAARCRSIKARRSVRILCLATMLSAAPACSEQAVGVHLGVPALVDYATATKSFEVTPDTVTSYFKKLVTLTSSKQDDAWRFTGHDAGTGILWAVVEFEQTARPGQWEFVDAEFALPPSSDGDGSTFVTLCSAIGKQLQRPKFACDKNPKKRVGWTFGADRSGTLQEGVFENPLTHERTRVTTLKLAILQGEDE